MASYRINCAPLVFLIAAAIGLTGCARNATEVPALDFTDAPFSESGSQKVPDRWWTALNDEGLNDRIDQALQANFDLETAWQRLQEARAILDRQSSDLLPDLDGQFEARTGNSRFDDDDRLRLELVPSYEIDLWGRIRSTVEAEEFRARASFEDYQAAALSLSARVARTWYRLMEARSQLALVQKQIETNQTVLRLIEFRFDAGQTRSVDVLRQKELVEFTREQKIVVESDIRVLEHQLAVLEGRPPQVPLNYGPHVLPALPPLPDVGLPADLVRRRPDVRRAFRQLQAADKTVAAAVSNRYPRLTITASVYTTENDTEDLFRDWTYAIAGNLFAPLYDGGQRAAEIERTEAVKLQRFFAYGQSVLTALREVEDALVQEQKQIQRIGSIEEQLRYSNRTYERLEFAYLNGFGNYLDVLAALTSNQALRRNLLTAKRQLVEFRIDLYRALAGGFKTGEFERLRARNTRLSRLADADPATADRQTESK